MCQLTFAVSHEVAHQWFSDLVTMEWWSHLWVNEGFATWVKLSHLTLLLPLAGYFNTFISFLNLYLILNFQVSYMATDIMFPEWKIWTQFLLKTNDGLRMDALEQSHPIEVRK